MSENNLVRVCPNCAAIHSESSTHCENCEVRLSSPMTGAEADKEIVRINKCKMEGEPKPSLVDKAEKEESAAFEPIEVTGTLKRIGIFNAILTVIQIVLDVFIVLIFNARLGLDSGIEWIAVLGMIAILTLVPVCSMLQCLAPNFGWSLSHLFRKWQYRSIQPSYVYEDLLPWITGIVTALNTIFIAYEAWEIVQWYLMSR